MNSLERYIYNLVRFSPKLKKTIVDLYQLLFSIIPLKKYKSDYKIIVREGYFYGFHDKCPWSADNKYLLAHKFKFDLKMPGSKDKVEIGLFKGNDFTDFESLATTKTWNWQMGAMLQWLGSTNNIIYNDFDGSKHICKIIDIKGNLINTFDCPIAAVNPQGTFALSHSFVRLKKVAPAYGYANGEEISANDNCPADDGVFLLNFVTGESKLLFSLEDITSNMKYNNNSYYYFTHCLFSPDGKRFAFYHRCVNENEQTWTRLFTCNVDGSDLFEFDFSGVVTHLAWQDEDHLLAYGLKKEIGDHYYLLKDRTNEFVIIGEQEFTSDGHPQYSPDRQLIITDTYPDRFRRQYLIRYDLRNEVRENIAILKSPLRFTGDIRCDLHPRWDRKGEYVCFDSAHTGSRSLCTIKLK